MNENETKIIIDISEKVGELLNRTECLPVLVKDIETLKINQEASKTQCAHNRASFKRDIAKQYVMIDNLKKAVGLTEKEQDHIRSVWKTVAVISAILTSLIGTTIAVTKCSVENGKKNTITSKFQESSHE